MSATDVKPNYFNLQELDVRDLQQEHDYLETRIEESTSALSLQGITTVDGMRVSEDSVISEPFDFPEVTQDETRPALTNFLDFPLEENRTESARMYTVFEAHSNNIQRIDLKVQMNIVTNSSFVTISILNLVNPSDPQSALGDNLLVRRTFRPDEVPTLDDGTTPLVVNFAGDNERTGISVTPGEYYAVVIEFTRETASQDVLRVFVSNREETTAIDNSLHSWVLFGTNFQQGLFTDRGAFTRFTIWNKVYSAAVKISPGTAFINGKPIRILEEQRWLGLVDRGGESPKNFVVASYKEEVAALESAARTGNNAVSRLRDSFETHVFTAAEFSNFAEDPENIYILLATVEDRNILAFRVEENYDIEGNVNLSYSDWLVPTNEAPSLAALSLLEQREDDLVFVADNVPQLVPRTDGNGVPVLGADGRQLTDTIQSVFLDVLFDGGQNKRTFQMFNIKETTSEPAYVTFAATITDPNNTDLERYTYPFDLDQFTVDTYYNYRAVTGTGNEIYIQDFDRVFGRVEVTSNEFVSIREEQYPSVVEAGARTIVLDEDLKLGEPALSSGVSGQELLGFETQFQDRETATPVGTSTNERIVPRTDTLHPDNDWRFGPLPVVDREGQPVTNTDSSVTNAYNSGDLTLLVNGVDITFSGSTSPDKGGRGSPMTIFGQITGPDGEDLLGKTVQFRNADGKDNTQQTTEYFVTRDTTTGNVIFNGVAMGLGQGSDAGFEQGEDVLIYIDDRQALDANNIPITVTFNAFTAASVKVVNFSARQYFTGKVIQSAGDHIVNGQVQVDAGFVAIDPESGRVYFAPGEDPDGAVTMQFIQLDSEIPKIDFYRTRLSPYGTRTSQPIANNDNAVQTAVAVGDIVISIDDKDIRVQDCTPVGPARVVADDPERELEDYEIAINPEEGTIVFDEKFFGTPGVPGEEPIITETTSIVVSYYHIIPVTISTVSQTFSTYDEIYDLNGDGRIDEEDLAIFNTAYPSIAGDPNYIPDADFNQDGRIDEVDAAEFNRHFGTSASGEKTYEEATVGRLDTMFAFNRDNPADRLFFVRAVSRAETAAQSARTILFLDNDSVVDARATYITVFGYPNLLENAKNEYLVTTEVDFVRPIDVGSIRGYEKGNVETTFDTVTSETVTRNTNEGIVYDTTFKFAPAIREDKTVVFESYWDGVALNVFDRVKRTSPLEYEENRQVKGPFDIVLGGEEFSPDGTFVELAIGARDSLLADGTPTSTGRYIHGVPIDELSFQAIVRVPTNDGTNEFDEWVWRNVRVNPETGLIRLEFDDQLLPRYRSKGRNGAVVLQPFGVADNQIKLAPMYAGGDIENSLSNILLYRDAEAEAIACSDFSQCSIPSDSITINNLCDFTGVNPTLTSALCEVKSIIQSTRQVGDYGNELVFVRCCSTGYGGDQPPIRIPTRIGDECFLACGPSVGLNPSYAPDPTGCYYGDYYQPYYYYDYYYDSDCEDCQCLIQIKIGKVECGYFEVEYCVDPCYTGDVLLNFNWSACGPICPCPDDEVPETPIIGEVAAIQECVFTFNAGVECQDANGQPIDGEPSYFWDLGDGRTTSTQRTFTHEYANPGTYKVTLVATCPDGRVLTDTLVVVVAA